MEKSLVPQCAHTDGGRCARCAAPMNPQLQSRFKSSLMHNVSMIIFRGSIDNEIAQRFGTSEGQLAYSPSLHFSE